MIYLDAENVKETIDRIAGASMMTGLIVFFKTLKILFMGKVRILIIKKPEFDWEEGDRKSKGKHQLVKIDIKKFENMKICENAMTVFLRL